MLYLLIYNTIEIKLSSFNYNYMKYNSKLGIESRMENGFSAMNVIF